MDQQLSRRERQIMEVLFRLGRATIAEVLPELPDPPTDSAIRAALRLLERKGQVRREGGSGGGPSANVYAPAQPVGEARNHALRQLLDTFFRGSRERAVAAMLDLDDTELSAEDLERLAEMIRARKRTTPSEPGGGS